MGVGVYGSCRGIQDQPRGEFAPPSPLLHPLAPGPPVGLSAARYRCHQVLKYRACGTRVLLFMLPDFSSIWRFDADNQFVAPRTLGFDSNVTIDGPVWTAETPRFILTNDGVTEATAVGWFPVQTAFSVISLRM